MKVRVKYSKQGLMKFIGHLDMMRFFQKALRRAGIDVVYTEGMSPHMSMSFALPLGVGMTSDSEYVDVDLVSALPGGEMIRRLNSSAPEGIHFTDVKEIPEGKAHKGMTLAARADYTLRFRDESEWDDKWKADFERWLSRPEILVMKKGKRTEKEINIRPLIFEAAGGEDSFTLGLGAGLDQNIRPELVMKAFAQDTGREYRDFMFLINRDEVFADQGKDGEHVFVPLISLGKVIGQGA